VSASPIRVFVDSNVLIEGLFAPWSSARAILILARASAFRLVLSPYVEVEVERALLA
jgi:predicted nucleic acid-binding protein